MDPNTILQDIYHLRGELLQELDHLHGDIREVGFFVLVVITMLMFFRRSK